MPECFTTLTEYLIYVQMHLLTSTVKAKKVKFSLLEEVEVHRVLFKDGSEFFSLTCRPRFTIPESFLVLMSDRR
jgi:hypothetical protein